MHGARSRTACAPWPSRAASGSAKNEPSASWQVEARGTEAETDGDEGVGGPHTSDEADLIDEAALKRAYDGVRKDAAVGVDGITKEQAHRRPSVHDTTGTFTGPSTISVVPWRSAAQSMRGA